ncbi:MAG: preprotein translocase subunit SecE [Bacteroidetes bacterium]|nr:preprotein translocase subunit SecE [Bacteroidota bacterium]MCZ6694118.1 preprotein translocase subunit SecE [Bacteroidota bacterium]
MSKILSFFKESKDEMVNKVTWPKYADLQNSSVLVLVASLIFAIIIGVMDFGFDETMNWFYSAF